MLDIVLVVVMAADADIPLLNVEAVERFSVTPPTFTLEENVVPVNDPHDWSVVFTSNAVTSPWRLNTSVLRAAIETVCAAIVTSCAACEIERPAIAAVLAAVVE